MINKIRALLLVLLFAGGSAYAGPLDRAAPFFMAARSSVIYNGLFDASAGNIVRYKLTSGSLLIDDGGDGNSFDLTNINGVTQGSGFEGGTNTAGQFTAANGEHLTHADSTIWNGFGSLTIAAHIYVDSLTSNRAIVAKFAGVGERSFYFVVDSDGKLRFSVFTDVSAVAANGDTVLSTGTWYTVFAEYDGTNTQVYIGTAADDPTPNALTGTIHDSTSLFVIGKRSDTANDLPASAITNFDGRIDDVAISNRAWSADEKQFYVDMMSENFTY